MVSDNAARLQILHINGSYLQTSTLYSGRNPSPQIFLIQLLFIGSTMGFLPKKSERPEGKIWPAVMVGLYASIGGILFGCDTAAISGILTMPYWVKTMATEVNAAGVPHITTTQESLVVSILSAGTFCGALLAGPLGDYLGRRMGLIASCVVFSIGVAMQTASTGLNLFIGGRVVAGLGVGLVSALGSSTADSSLPKRR
jgi:SP family sugar:H+ symporter-like MFS transporter